MATYPITPEFMQELPEAIVVLYERLADYLIADICSRLKYNETATATTIRHIKQLLKNGYDLDNINKGEKTMPYIGSSPRIFQLHSRNRMTV